VFLNIHVTVDLCPLKLFWYHVSLPKNYVIHFGIYLLSKKIIEYRNKWKAYLQRMKHTRIPLQAYKYQPSGKRDIDQEDDGETHNNTRTGDSPNP
jgi:hypothetical protein